LDVNRCLDASRQWLGGDDPYAVPGFVYAPVEVTLMAPLSLLPAAVADMGWAVAHIALAAGSAWMLTPFLKGLDRVAAVTAVTVMPAVLADAVWLPAAARWHPPRVARQIAAEADGLPGEGEAVAA
jgi:hypothetical protein